MCGRTCLTVVVPGMLREGRNTRRGNALTDTYGHGTWGEHQQPCGAVGGGWRATAGRLAGDEQRATGRER